MRVEIVKGKKGDFIGDPFCLIDRREQNKVREGEEWEVDVVRAIKDKRGKEVKIVKPVKRVLRVRGGEVYCGDLKVPAEKRIVEAWEEEGWLKGRMVFMTDRGEKVEAEDHVSEEEVLQFGEEKAREFVRRRREKWERRKREEIERRMREIEKAKRTFPGRLKAEIEKARVELKEKIRKAKEKLAELEREESSAKVELEKEIQKLEEKRKELLEARNSVNKMFRVPIPSSYSLCKSSELLKVRKEVYEVWTKGTIYRRSRPLYRIEVFTFPNGEKTYRKYSWVEERGYREDGDHFVGLGREWVDGWSGWKLYREGNFNPSVEEMLGKAEKQEEEVMEVFADPKRIFEDLTLKIQALDRELERKREELRNAERKEEEKKVLRKFLRNAEKFGVQVINEGEGLAIVAYPVEGGLRGVMVMESSEEIGDVDDYLAFSEGPEDTPYPETLNRFIEIKEGLRKN